MESPGWVSDTSNGFTYSPSGPHIATIARGIDASLMAVAIAPSSLSASGSSALA
jgi:hypothetical protein